MAASLPVPRAPTSLGRRGRRLWREILTEYELSPVELQILAEAAAVLDRIEELRVAIAEDGVRAHGSKGQPVVNPLLAELRGQQTLAKELLAALPDEEEAVSSLATGHQQRARTAAVARWAKRDRQRHHLRGVTGGA